MFQRPNDTLLGLIARPADNVRDRFAIDCRCSSREMFPDLREHARHAARLVELLHVMTTRRLKIDKQRDRLAHFVEQIQIQFETDSSAKRRKVNHGIGRSADRLQDNQRVANCIRRDDVTQRWRVAHGQPGGHPAGLFGQTHALCTSGGRRAAHRQAKPHRLDEARHGACGSHDRAGADRTHELVVDLRQSLPGRFRRRDSETRIGGSRCRRRASHPR